MDKTAIKFNLNIRSQKIIDSLKYNQILKEENEKFKLGIKDDKKLTLCYRETASALLNLTYESMAILINNRDADRLFSLKFGEFENFLRDQNIERAYGPNEEELLSLEFHKFKTDLILAFLELGIEDRPDVNDFIGIIRYIHKLISRLNSYLKGGEGIKFLHFENGNLYYSFLNTTDNCHYPEMISAILQKKLNQKINLVAV